LGSFFIEGTQAFKQSEGDALVGECRDRLGVEILGLSAIAKVECARVHPGRGQGVVAGTARSKEGAGGDAQGDQGWAADR
jgi:hypothetical protein